jgi:TRAP-type C4-dicarboxylate transport system permease small subunit
MAGATDLRTQGHHSLVRSIITWWALLGGILLPAVVVMNVVSVVGSALFAKPFPGDFEMTGIGVCIAAFSFLPYCQMTGANVTADIFTAQASAKWQAVFALIGAIVALLFSLLLLWRMWDGMLDQKEYGYTTAIVQFPHWIAFIPILSSLLLLAVAAALSIKDAWIAQSHG